MLHDPPVAATPIPERGAVDADTYLREIVPSYRPVVLRGQVAHWPAVAAGRAGPRAIAEYLLRFGGGQPLETLVAPPEIAGRFSWTDDLTGFNFRKQHVPLAALLGELVKLAEGGEPRPFGIYANAATAPEHLPGWAEQNPLGLPTTGATPRLWIGNATQTATHYDESTNVAVVVAGRRRFTLFPPDQIANLYLGPIDRTMAGAPSSLVDPDAPDLSRFPRFAEALAHAQVAELEPGDAIVIPAIWWHHVRALAPLNVLVNYWWQEKPGESPFLAMIHALMAVRDLPPDQKAAWRGWFDHFVFGEDAADAGAHLPPHAQGVLGPGGPERTERMRGFLARALSRP